MQKIKILVLLAAGCVAALCSGCWPVDDENGDYTEINAGGDAIITDGSGDGDVTVYTDKSTPAVPAAEPAGAE